MPPWYRAQKRQRQQIRDRVGAATETALRLGHEVTAGVQAELLDVLFEAARERGRSGRDRALLGRPSWRWPLPDSARKDRDLELRHQKLELGRNAAWKCWRSGSR